MAEIIFCIFAFVGTFIWKFRYLKGLDLPVRYQKEPWKINAIYWGIMVGFWILTALSFVLFGSPIKHDRTFGDDPVGDSIVCMAIAVFLPNFIMWGVRKPSKAIMLIACGSIFLLISLFTSEGVGSELKTLMIVCAVLIIGAGMVGGKLFFWVVKIFTPKFKSRRKFRALQKPKYSRDVQTGRLVREKSARRERDNRRRRDDDDEDEEDDD